MEFLWNLPPPSVRSPESNFGQTAFGGQKIVRYYDILNIPNGSSWRVSVHKTVISKGKTEKFARLRRARKCWAFMTPRESGGPQNLWNLPPPPRPVGKEPKRGRGGNFQMNSTDGARAPMPTVKNMTRSAYLSFLFSPFLEQFFASELKLCIIPVCVTNSQIVNFCVSRIMLTQDPNHDTRFQLKSATFFDAVEFQKTRISKK